MYYFIVKLANESELCENEILRVNWNDDSDPYLIRVRGHGMCVVCQLNLGIIS